MTDTTEDPKPQTSAPPSVVKEFGKSFGRPIVVGPDGKVAVRIYEQGFRHYLVERSDGGISLFTLIDDPNINSYPLIEDEIEKWHEINDKYEDGHPFKGMRATKNYFVIAEAFPQKAAWLQDAFVYRSRERVEIDLERARPIYLRVLRDVRNQKLKELDPQGARAAEEEDKAAMKKVVAQKKILRDLPSVLLEQIQKAPSLRELFDTWPRDQLGNFPYHDTAV